MNNLLSNYPGSDMPVVVIVMALFALVTVYYGLLIVGFGRSWKKLITSYTVIVALLILILLISQYYFLYFNNYAENFIADYPANTTRNEHKNDNNYYMNHVAFTKNPFSSGFNVDTMCKSSTSKKIDHDDIAWKCSVRNIYKQDSFTLKPTEDDVKSSVKYPLKYDGIFNLKQ
jgi:uncharacterized protein YjeT (DUF2065 family)